jgi:hypothetical protein
MSFVWKWWFITSGHENLAAWSAGWRRHLLEHRQENVRSEFAQIVILQIDLGISEIAFLKIINSYQ